MTDALLPLNMGDVDRCSDPDRPEFWLTSAMTRMIPAEDLEGTFEEIVMALMVTPDDAHEVRAAIREWVLEMADEVPPEMGRDGDATWVILGKHIEALLREDEDARRWARDRRAISRETREWLKENPGPIRGKIDAKMINRVSRRE